MLKKIISGGQTGVDRGALEAASQRGYDIGGWCPPNRKAEDGQIPEDLPLKETPKERSQNAQDVPRSLRTEWNVRDADATLILMPKPNIQKDRGTKWTTICCRTMNKPYFICDPFDTNAISQIANWLQKVSPTILNVAGPMESKIPGIQKATKKVLFDVLR